MPTKEASRLKQPGPLLPSGGRCGWRGENCIRHADAGGIPAKATETPPLVAAVSLEKDTA